MGWDKGWIWLIAAAVGGCGAIYPERSTPVRSLPPSSEVEVAPPTDTYFVYVASAVIPGKTRDGRALDPDPFARLVVDDQELFSTPVESGTRRPSWPNQHFANYVIHPEQTIYIEVWDDNPLNDHPLCRELVPDLRSLSEVGEREIHCDDTGARVTLHVEPARYVWGMGLYYELRGSTGAFVTRVARNSPASRAGLQPGDRFVSINGKPGASLDALGVQSVINQNVREGLELDIAHSSGKTEHVTLREGPIYPLAGDDLALPQNRPAPSSL